ncbi:unnamed protein product [Clavelina lepadiformis]|uniref:Uncharacterized protein n=1 Tax=Clavelina lepadiformis TaxID=159417 RepID=A0ABP0FRQ3_CLALP
MLTTSFSFIIPLLVLLSLASLIAVAHTANYNPGISQENMQPDRSSNYESSSWGSVVQPTVKGAHENFSLPDVMPASNNTAMLIVVLGLMVPVFLVIIAMVRMNYRMSATVVKRDWQRLKAILTWQKKFRLCKSGKPLLPLSHGAEVSKTTEKKSKYKECKCKQGCYLGSCFGCSTSCSCGTKVSSCDRSPYCSTQDFNKIKKKVGKNSLPDLDKLRNFFFDLAASHTNGLKVGEARLFASEYGVPAQLFLSEQPLNDVNENIIAAQFMIKSLKWIQSKKLAVTAKDVIKFFDEEMQMRGLADDMRLAAGYSPAPESYCSTRNSSDNINNVDSRESLSHSDSASNAMFSEESSSYHTAYGSLSERAPS